MKKYTFSFVIIFAVSIAYFFPQYFISYNGIKLSSFIVPFLQLIMFGMGTTLSLADFKGILNTPKLVFIGLGCQFLIMPFWGLGLTKIFDFPTEIAAGILLVGCSPSGLASNVMALLAKANVALSITVTAFATMLAPILTPFLMKILAGTLIEIDFLSMMWDMTKIVLLPVIIGFAINKLFPVYLAKVKHLLPVLSMIGISFVIIAVTAAGNESLKTVGLTLLLAVIMHNIGGYVFGYFSAKAFGLNKQNAKTIALEVGLQNAGLASALANEMGKLATVGLASGIFGPMMNLSGSILASWWGNKPLDQETK